VYRTPTLTATSTPTSLPTLTPTPDPRLPPERWQEWPVVPGWLSQAMLEVYQLGLVRGNSPQAFSKIGDGEISTVWFLTNFDLGAAYYNLGEHTELQPVIANFSGSFERVSLAAGSGYNTTIVLDAGRADKSRCLAGESPLDCELRQNRPAFAIISMGTNQVWYPETFESEMRLILDDLLRHGVIPILSTKADNLEGNHAINASIARLADEYEVPLWNFWRAVQLLPDHGLQADLEHLTYAENDFSNLAAMRSAWPWRNLTALQTLDYVWQETVSNP
jgi:hypothetical protein